MNSGYEGWNSGLANPEAFEAIITQVRAALVADASRSFESYLWQYSYDKSQAFVDGLENYTHHPYRHHNYRGADKVNFGDGFCLYRFAPPKRRKPRGSVLLVPSLVNRGYIMDLLESLSLARFLQKRGLDVWILEWRNPITAKEPAKAASFDDYIADLCTSIEHIRNSSGNDKISLLGYCMGGIFALAAAQLQRQSVLCLSLVASPWDFSAYNSAYHKGLIAMIRLYGQFLQQQSACPPLLWEEMVQSYFWCLNPCVGLNKFANFASLPMASSAAQKFVALEDWLNDSAPLGVDLAVRLCEEWYGCNLTQAGRFQIGGESLQLSKIEVPVQIVIAAKDRVVPPASSAALLGGLLQARAVTVPLGHIGIMASERAETLLWGDIADFFLNAT